MTPPRVVTSHSNPGGVSYGGGGGGWRAGGLKVVRRHLFLGLGEHSKAAPHFAPDSGFFWTSRGALGTCPREAVARLAGR